MNKMKIFKSLQLVVFFIVIIVILVAVRTYNKNLFKRDSKTAVEASKNNHISVSELEALENSYLIIDLREEITNSNQIQKSVHIPFENILEKTNWELLENSESDILLYANDLAVSAKAWVILNQLNFENVYILSEEENPEVLKYKFQPDTMVRLE